MQKYKENTGNVYAFILRGHVTKKKLIQHAIFAHNTQINFLTKTGKIDGIFENLVGTRMIQLENWLHSETLSGLLSMNGYVFIVK